MDQAHVPPPHDPTLAERVRRLEVVVNGNGRPGLAENVRLLMTQGESHKLLLEAVKTSTDQLLSTRLMDEARREGSRRAITQIRGIAIIMLTLLGLDLSVGLREMFALLPLK
jgi:hypothetical protein